TQTKNWAESNCSRTASAPAWDTGWGWDSSSSTDSRIWLGSSISTGPQSDSSSSSAHASIASMPAAVRATRPPLAAAPSPLPTPGGSFASTASTILCVIGHSAQLTAPVATAGAALRNAGDHTSACSSHHASESYESGSAPSCVCRSAARGYRTGPPSARAGGLADVCRRPGQPGQTRSGERGAQTQQMLVDGDRVSSADRREGAGPCSGGGADAPLMAKGDVRKAHALIQTCSPVPTMRVRDGVDEPVTAGRAHITMPEGREKPSSAAARCVEGWCQNLATEAFVASDRISALS